MMGQTVISLAILKANWDLRGQDYLDNFVLLVAECIRLDEHDVVSVPVMQQSLREQFGLTLPQGAIKTILGRVRKRGYIRSEHGVYLRNRDKLENLSFKDIQQRVLRSHASLLHSLVSFCREKYEVSWSTNDADTALLGYLAENEAFVVSAATNGTLIPVTGGSSKSSRFLVSAFIRHLQESRASDLTFLEDVVKGNMLANAVFLPDPSQAQKRFRNTEVFFDTPFLLQTLGYMGGPLKEPGLELLELLVQTGARLCCFQHTVDEIRGVLDSCAGVIRMNKLREARGPIIEQMLQAGKTASDLELYAIRIADNLRSLGINVIESPVHIYEHAIDEEDLQATLEKRVTYRNPDALWRDVVSISATIRLRRGAYPYSIEESKAIFVTTNTGLAAAANEFYYKDAPPRAVTPCLTDYTMTNLLWLKRPIAAPDLPRNRIIADCYAAMQPDENPDLWRRYLTEIDKLNREGLISDQDYFLLRHSLEAKHVLMDLTLGDDTTFSQGMVPELLERMHSAIRGELEQKLDQEQALRRGAEQVSQEVAERLQEQQNRMAERERMRQARIRNRAEHHARVVVNAMKLALLFLFLVATFIAIPWSTESLLATSLRILVSATTAVISVLSLVSLVYPSLFDRYVSRVEASLADRIERALHSETDEGVS